MTNSVQNQRTHEESTHLLQPIYYHRDYENDIKNLKPQNTIFQKAQRITTIALPFISLYKPLGSTISIVMNSTRSFSCLMNTKEALTKGEAKEIGIALFQSALAASAVVGTIFGNFYGMTITSGHDVLISLYETLQLLNEGEYEKAFESFLKLTNNSLYLTMLLHGSLEIVILSFAAQILLEVYKSQDSFRKFKNGDVLDILEGLAHLGMAGIRGYQMQPQLKMLQFKIEMQNIMKKQPLKQGQIAEPSKHNSNDSKITKGDGSGKKDQISQENCVKVDVKNSVNSSRIIANKVEWINYQGVYNQIGYYNDFIVITNYTGQYVYTNDGVQKSYSSSHYTELLNGISYLVYTHNGGKIYSAELSQFVIIY